MTNPTDDLLLGTLLDSWIRGNTILVNLLRALPEGALGVRPMDSSPTVAQLFTHIHSVRLSLVAENAPEFAVEPPAVEWVDERDTDRIRRMLDESADVVRRAVHGRLLAGRGMDRIYDHPILLLQHLLWHEAYHHGQVKLALKLAGLPIVDREAGPLTWSVWMRRA